MVSIPASADDLETVIVTADASVSRVSSPNFSVSALDYDEVEWVQAEHPNGILSRVPGIWVTRNSGQEHLTGIRSGVLTGPGACGAFLLLENGIPVRPAGFCNVNGLFEVNIEQANRVEVVRGPASSRYGGNALHGMINAITVGDRGIRQVAATLGADDMRQVRLNLNTDAKLSAHFHSTSTDGYRDETGYSQQKLSLNYPRKNRGNWTAQHTLSVSLLNQETGGYVRGYRAYESNDLRFSNPNPEAYRDAYSIRYAEHWNRDRIHVIPYLRHSSMEFLQHFLPGQPLEKNSQISGGVITRWETGTEKLAWSFGQATEIMGAELTQIQHGPTIGSAFLVATRPAGTHYDYTVNTMSAAAFQDLDWTVSESLNVVHGGRIEYLRYDYDNLTLDGNTRDDGTTCGFDGCLYTRPADRSDAFTNFAVNGGIAYRLNESAQFFLMSGMGFRPPQATELYRLQSGQEVADLESEGLVSLEAGFSRTTAMSESDVKLYVQRKRDAILRDSEGLNVNRGKTRSHGLEFSLSRKFGERNRFALNATWARHTYAFTQQVAQGEQITSGNDVDSAPRFLFSGHWDFEVGANFRTELELTHVGSHYVNASNTAKYGGHNVFNLRGWYQVNETYSLQARVMNLLDTQYADRADFAFGSYRYFPARPRQFFLTFRWDIP